MRALNKSRIELYVENYLKSRIIRKTTEELNYLRKAAAYIEYALFYDFCTFDEAVVQLYTHRDNQFTRTIYHMINNIGVDKYRKSLERTLTILKSFINN